jgi:AI-2 transport protein TqsA
MSINKVSHGFIVLTGIILALIYGKSLLIPFVFALLLWFLIREVRHRLDKIKVVKNKFPSWVKNLISSASILLILAFLSRILLSSINNLASSYESYETNVEQIILDINTMFNINLTDVVKDHAGDVDFGQILSSLFGAISEIFGNAFIILFYTLFIFLEESNFQYKLKKIFPTTDKFEMVTNTLEKVEKSIARYIGLKTLVSLLTGTLSFTALYFLDVDSPVFWAFLIFLLNFIPTIGSLIGTVFPAVFCLLQFGEFMAGLQVLLFVGLIQVLVGNIIEPKLMGNSLNLSSLVAIVALSFWGVLWGVTGMILSVPVTVIMIILFAEFEKTKPIAIMLSEKGDV